MNNACPSCGAVYAVAPKDVGRKIKCKKCSTALRIDDVGLVLDEPLSPPAVPSPPRSTPAPSAPPPSDFELEQEEEVVVGKSKKPKGYARGTRGGVLAEIGGVPTILFSIGIFMVIWFTFMTPIGEAAILRSGANVLKVKRDLNNELKKVKDDPSKQSKILEEYAKKEETASTEAADSLIDNVRSIKFEKYGQMFGFLLVAFGCIGYLRTEQPIIIHYVAGVILAGMMLVVFSIAGGCGGGQKNEMMDELMKLTKGGR